jgi:hypothetical protein
MTPLACLNDARRTAVRKSPMLAGFDYLEVNEDHLTLRVYFLGRLPPTPLTNENFRVEGGRRVRDIQVVGVFPKQFNDPELDDYVEVVVNRFGDFSEYTLRAVARVAGERGSKWVPHPEFDPFYNQLRFHFTADCPTDLDCPPGEACPVPDRVQPAINYLAKDYASFRQLILDRLAVVMPDWRNRFVPDIGITLVEVLAYAGDYLSYYQDAVATEAYLNTARQRISVRRHARLVDYAVHEGCNARAFVVVTTTADLRIEPGGVEFITPPARNLPVELTREAIGSFNSATFQVFEAMSPTDLHPGHDTISIYTWGDRECCLRRGATTATLVDEWIGEGGSRTRKLKLQRGDFLIFEEVVGPKTGAAADRDPLHRWPIRLTSVAPDVDPLSGAPVLNIAWAKDDALPFLLCLSTIGPAPDCALITDVSVARGNVVLVDHGRTVEEDLPPVPSVQSTPACDGEGLVGEVTRTAGPFGPRLMYPNLTFREPPAAKVAAANVLAQDPHAAIPNLTLNNDKWTSVGDLLDSRSSDRHFVAEMDNDRVAHLRFGDGIHGQFPPPGVAFHARYRIGVGTIGNVGAEAIAHVVWPATVSKVITGVRNPMAARGGVDPQSIQEVKLFAPRAFRKRLERAITADDYALIAQREFPREVQRAAATLRWNGSWYEALVAIDPFGSGSPDRSLIRRVWRRLEEVRRIGHDLRVEAATRVPVVIWLTICVKAVYLRAHVLADLETRFGTAKLADGSLEFFHPDNLTFGRALYLSQVVSVAQSVPGVESVRVKKFERLFDGPQGEIDAGLIRFGPFEIAQCDSDPSVPDNGQIRFDVGGGR